MKQAFLYALKVWLTAILFGALLLTIISLFNAKEMDMSSSALDYLFFLVVFIAEGIIYSIILFVFLAYSTTIITKKSWSTLKKKLITALVAEAAYTLLFCIIFHNALFKSDTLSIWPPFGVGLLLSIWIYRIPVSANVP